MRVAIVLGAGLVATAALVGAGALRGFDAAATAAVQSAGNTPADWILSVFSYLGCAEVTGPIALGLAVLHARRRRWRPAAMLIAALALGTLLELVGKAYVPQPRPDPALHRAKLRAHVMHVQTKYAFPSGHTFRTTLLAFAAATLAAAVRRRRAVLAATAVAILMGLTRVYLGDHHAADILGGWLLAGTMLFAFRLERETAPV